MFAKAHTMKATTYRGQGKPAAAMMSQAIKSIIGLAPGWGTIGLGQSLEVLDHVGRQRLFEPG